MYIQLCVVIPFEKKIFHTRILTLIYIQSFITITAHCTVLCTQFSGQSRRVIAATENIAVSQSTEDNQGNGCCHGFSLPINAYEELSFHFYKNTCSIPA